MFSSLQKMLRSCSLLKKPASALQSRSPTRRQKGKLQPSEAEAATGALEEAQRVGGAHEARVA